MTGGKLRCRRAIRRRPMEVLESPHVSERVKERVGNPLWLEMYLRSTGE